MGSLSIRLPEDLERRLAEEARRSGLRRSELVREAVGEYVVRRERERYLAELAAEARRLYGNPETRSEGLEIAEDTADEGLDALVEAERRAGIDPDEKWWR